MARNINNEQRQEILRDGEFNRIKSHQVFIKELFEGSELTAAMEYYNIAEDLFKIGAIRNPRQHYQLAQFLDNSELRNPDFHHGLAILELEEGNLDAPITQLKKAVEADRQLTEGTSGEMNWEYHFLLGNAFQSKASQTHGIDSEDSLRAANSWYTTIESNGSDIIKHQSFLIERGKLYLALGLYDETIVDKARKAFKDAQGTQEQDSIAITLFHEARLLAITGELREALSNLNTVLRQDPTYWQRAREEPDFSALRNDGEFEEKFNEYLQTARSTALSFGKAQGKAEKGEVLAREGRLGESLLAYRAAVQIDSKNKEYRFRLARANKAMGQQDVAAREYHIATSLDTGYALAYCKLAELYESLREVENAQTNWNLCLQLSAENDTKIWAKRALEQLSAVPSS